MYFYLVDSEAPMAPALWTCSRPIPGDLIGWRNGMGYGVYHVEHPFIRAAQDLDAHPMMPITKEAWVKLVDGYLMDRSDGDYSLADYYEAFPNSREEAERAAAETLVGEIRLATIEPV